MRVLPDFMVYAQAEKRRIPGKAGFQFRHPLTGRMQGFQKKPMQFFAVQGHADAAPGRETHDFG
jgi:carbamoylphosphate synthase small subunit